MTPAQDVAATRLDNALRLFDEFVQAAARHPDAATLRGLERRFAERLQIQPSYWSQIKGRSRQIGERLARQFERQCHKPPGWMDQRHDPAPPEVPAEDGVPRDADERFIVTLVLGYYRRHPQRARTRLLDLLGEVLAPAPGPTAPVAPVAPKAPEPSASDLWRQTQAGATPLRHKR